MGERVDSYCIAQIKKGLFTCKEGRERERETKNWNAEEVIAHSLTSLTG